VQKGARGVINTVVGACGLGLDRHDVIEGETPLPLRTAPPDGPASRTPAGLLLTSCEAVSMVNGPGGNQGHDRRHLSAGV
jgi:hypothetical protein